jgi:hypothetical protein
MNRYILIVVGLYLFSLCSSYTVHKAYRQLTYVRLILINEIVKDKPAFFVSFVNVGRLMQPMRLVRVDGVVHFACTPAAGSGDFAML